MNKHMYILDAGGTNMLSNRVAHIEHGLIHDDNYGMLLKVIKDI
jgi:hypothetical protein